MMSFLRALFRWFSKSLAVDLPDRCLTFVHEGGDIARFVFRKRDLFANGLPKRGAFAPEPFCGRFETSICGLNGVSMERLWHLGRTLRAGSGMSALAALKLSVLQVGSTGLSCEAAPRQDCDEHGVIVGWDDDVDAKDARLAAQQELAALVSLECVMRPPPSGA